MNDIARRRTPRLLDFCHIDSTVAHRHLHTSPPPIVKISLRMSVPPDRDIHSSRDIPNLSDHSAQRTVSQIQIVHDTGARTCRDATLLTHGHAPKAPAPTVAESALRAPLAPLHALQIPHPEIERQIAEVWRGGSERGEQRGADLAAVKVQASEVRERGEEGAGVEAAVRRDGALVSVGGGGGFVGGREGPVRVLGVGCVELQGLEEGGVVEEAEEGDERGAVDDVSLNGWGGVCGV